MTLVIWSEECRHAQDVLINCSSYADMAPYLAKAVDRKSCVNCHKRLGKLAIIVLKGEAELAALKDPDAIDMSRR